MKSDVVTMEYDNDARNAARPGFIERSLSDEQNRSLTCISRPGSEHDLTFGKKPKSVRDPLSHKIVEKQRRDHMNNCLADLSQLIPLNILKQGHSRIEKTLIIEMAIKHIKNLTSMTTKQGALKSSLPDRYLGFKECQDEVMRYLVEVEGWDAYDKLCNRMMSHLEQAGEKFRIMNDDSLSRDAKEEQYRHVDEDRCPDDGISQLVPKQLGAPEHRGAVKLGVAQSPEYEKNMSSQLMCNSSNTQVQTNLSQIPTINFPEPLISKTQVTYNSFKAFANAQKITEEYLKQDKQLWTLVPSKINYDDSGVSTGMESVSSGMRNHSKYSRTANSEYKDPQEPVSGTTCNSTTIVSSTSMSMDVSSDKNDSSVYKFKHSITKRFSGQENKSPSNSSISSCSRVDKWLKRKLRHSCSHSPSSSNSSQYPNSDTSNNNTSGHGDSSSNSEDVKPIDLLPGFVLHPNGTHYMPLSIHPSNIDSYLFPSLPDNNWVYHPISIPVNFGGPTLFIKKVGIKKIESYEVRSLNSTGASSDTSSQSACCLCQTQMSVCQNVTRTAKLQNRSLQKTVHRCIWNEISVLHICYCLMLSIIYDNLLLL